jgi:hypothetical protein
MQREMLNFGLMAHLGLLNQHKLVNTHKLYNSHVVKFYVFLFIVHHINKKNLKCLYTEFICALITVLHTPYN